MIGSIARHLSIELDLIRPDSSKRVPRRVDEVREYENQKTWVSKHSDIRLVSFVGVGIRSKR